MRNKTAVLVTALVVLGCLTGFGLSAISYSIDFSDAERYMAVDAWGRPRGDDTSKYTFIRKIIAKAGEYMSRTFSANGFSSGTSFTVNSFTTPFSGRNVGSKSVEADIYVYVDFYSDSSNQIMTYGTIHQKDNTTGRPTVGSLSINLPLVTIANRNIYHYFPIVMFDLFKIMVFDKSLFGNYRDSSTLTTVLNRDTIIKNIQVDGKGYDSIVADQGSSFLTTAKNVYGSQLQGVILQDSSDEYYGMNSFTKSLYPNDWLNPTEEIPCLLTNVAAKFAAATGWYTVTDTNKNFQVNWVGKLPATQAPDTTFGTKKCLQSTSMGYCNTDSQRSCSPDGMYKVICKKDEYSGDCFYQGGTDYCTIDEVQGERKDWEYYGKNSRCVMMKEGTNQYPACVLVDATTTTPSATFKSKDGATTWTCADATTDVAGVGTLTSVTAACSSTVNMIAVTDANKCTNDCNGNGICLNQASPSGTGECFCFWGKSGGECIDDNSATEPSLIPISPFADGLVRLDNANLLTSVLAIFALISAIMV